MAGEYIETVLDNESPSSCPTEIVPFDLGQWIYDIEAEERRCENETRTAMARDWNDRVSAMVARIFDRYHAAISPTDTDANGAAAERREARFRAHIDATKAQATAVLARLKTHRKPGAAGEQNESAKIAAVIPTGCRKITAATVTPPYLASDGYLVEDFLKLCHPSLSRMYPECINWEGPADAKGYPLMPARVPDDRIPPTKQARRLACEFLGIDVAETRTEERAAIVSRISINCAASSVVIALSACGRLSVTSATRPPETYSTSTS